MSAETQPADGESPGELDAKLIAQTLGGHGPAYDELVRRYHRRAVAVAYRLLNNADDAADVAQDAFLRAYRGLASLRDRHRFGSWLMRIVSNLALNFRRSRKAALLEDLEDVGGQLRGADGRPVVREVPADEASISAELRAAIGRAISALPNKQRLALVLFAMEGMPQKEVAEVMNCSVELVKWNVFQARKKLRETLAEHL